MRDVWMFFSKDGYLVVKGKTFYLREKLKDAGGRWDAEKKHWVLPPLGLNQARAAGVSLLLPGRREAFCHEEALENILVDEEDLKRGYTTGNFCGNCDSHHGPNVRVWPLKEEGDKKE